MHCGFLCGLGLERWNTDENRPIDAPQNIHGYNDSYSLQNAYNCYACEMSVGQQSTSVEQMQFPWLNRIFFYLH